MNWQGFEIVWQLRSPLHVGWGKVGNLQRTRPYVWGRAFWGALTHRLTRDTYIGKQAASDSVLYQDIGKQVDDQIAFTYLYPALKTPTGYTPQWPWDKTSPFERRFLQSYASTALNYPQQSAAESTLHEIEYISPHTIESNPKSVFLTGYIFVKSTSTLNWRGALTRLQLGGERGYGWGDVRLVTIQEISSTSDLFNVPNIQLSLEKERPQLDLAKNTYLLAHTLPKELPLHGELDPLVGREWRSTQKRSQYAGQYVAYDGQAIAPGGQVTEASTVTIGPYGVWESI